MAKTKETQTNKAIEVRFVEATDLKGRAERDAAGGFRQLTDARLSSLNPISQDRLLKTVRFLYYNNPLGSRLIEIPTDYCFDVEVKAEDGAHEGLQELIENFWHDPYNDMPNFIVDLIEKRNADGELLLPVEVNQQTGAVNLKYQDPLNIDTIEALADDMKFVDKVTMKQTPGEEVKVYDIIRYRTEADAIYSIGSEDTNNLIEKSARGFRTGDAFYFRQRHLITGRGRSPLEPVINLLHAHDRTCYDQLRSIALQDMYWIDVTIKGASDTEIQKRADEYAKNGPPKTGSTRFHSDNETWTALSPNLNPDVAGVILPQLRRLIGLGAGGKAETWVGASADVNRSTAEVSDMPPLRHLEREQKAIENIIRAIIDFVIDMAILHGAIDLDKDDKKLRAFRVELPDVSPSDNLKTAQALSALMTALQAALDSKLIDRETARSLFFRMAGTNEPMNLDENIQAQEEADSTQDYNQTPLPPALVPNNPAAPQPDAPGGNAA